MVSALHRFFCLRMVFSLWAGLTGTHSSLDALPLSFALWEDFLPILRATPILESDNPGCESP